MELERRLDFGWLELMRWKPIRFPKAYGGPFAELSVQHGLPLPNRFAYSDALRIHESLKN